MARRRSGRARLFAAIIAMPCIWVAAPIHAGAVTTAVTDSAVCQVSSLTITATPGLSLVATVSATGTLLWLNAAGSCDGAGFTNEPFTLQGSSTAIGPATCAELATDNGSATLTLGTQYPVQYAFAGPTAAGTWVLTATWVNQLGTANGIFDVALSGSSALACATGTASSLDYTGVAAIVFS